MRKPKGCGCGRRAKKMLDLTDKYALKMPRAVRTHLEKTAAKEENEIEEMRDARVR